jgi:D-2-hydroxyacid dehydrogenase (NADP+)
VSFFYSGSAVDEEALCKALQDDTKVIHAAMDVFHTEPLPSSSQLWNIPNDRLLITSHNADYTADYFELGWEVFNQNLKSFLTGGAMATQVDKNLMY